VFLEEWTNISLDNPYVIRAMEPARDGSLYEVYATDAGLWFPVSLLETLGEIQDLGDSEYRILKWPADDRSHCGG